MTTNNLNLVIELDLIILQFLNEVMASEFMHQLLLLNVFSSINQVSCALDKRTQYHL